MSKETQQPSKEKYGMRHRHFVLQGSKSFGWLDFLFLSRPAKLAFCFSSPKSTFPWQDLVPARNSIYPIGHVCPSRQCWRDCSKTGHLCGGSLPLAGQSVTVTPSLSPRHSDNKPAKAPITRLFPFPGAGDLPGGIHIPAFLR